MPIGLNRQIMEHALSSADWRHVGAAGVAYPLYERLNSSEFESNLPEIVIGFDESGRLRKVGSYHYEGDSLGLKHHIDLRPDLQPLELVIGVIYGCVHIELETYQLQKSWYHGLKFRKRMKSLGLICTPGGDVDKIEITRFSDVLNKIGMGHLLTAVEDFVKEPPAPVDAGEEESVEPIPIPPHPSVDKDEDEVGEASTQTGDWDHPDTVSVKDWLELAQQPTKTTGDDGGNASHVGAEAPTVANHKPKSKMIKWSCSCTNVRCAVTLAALCTKCGGAFVITDKNLLIADVGQLASGALDGGIIWPSS